MNQPHQQRRLLQEKNEHKTNTTKKQRQQQGQRKKKRLRELERDAAKKTFHRSGTCPDLPSLPPIISKKKKKASYLEPHPYGVLPSGNQIFLSTTTTTTRTTNPRISGLGPWCSALTDEHVLIILGYLDGVSLSNVGQCSRYCYVMGHVDDLWRDLTLRLAESRVTKQSGDGDGGRIDWPEEDENGRGMGWKDTFVHMLLQQEEDVDNNECMEDNNGREEKKDDESKRRKDDSSRYKWNAKYKRHIPIAMSGIYSDTLYRPWLCRSLLTDPFLFDDDEIIENVDRIPHDQLTKEIFLDRYEGRNRPLIIENATRSWPALHHWKDLPRYLSSKQQQQQQQEQQQQEQEEECLFRATSSAAPLSGRFTMSSYDRYCRSDAVYDEAPMYLFDRTFVSKVPSLGEDYLEALGKSCPYLDRKSEHGHDLFGLLGEEEERPDYRWIIAGPKRSGSAFHIDPNCTHAWNAPITSPKRWIFYPPNTPPPGVHPSPNGDDVLMPITIGEWFLSHWSQHCECRTNNAVNCRPLECTVRPGDLLFVPHGWWHMVWNLDEGDKEERKMNVALTQNYVSRSNLGDVLRFLERKVSQISGCRDRVVENDNNNKNKNKKKRKGAIRPEDLSYEFRRVLREKRPDLLEVGEAEAKKGWSCRAWKDDEDDDEAVPVNEDGAVMMKKRRIEGGVQGFSVLDRAKLPKTSLNGGSDLDSKSGFGGGGFSFSFV